MVEIETGKWSEEENNIFKVLLILFGPDQLAITMLLQSRPDKNIKSRIHRIKNPDKALNGVVQETFGDLADYLKNENHNTFSVYINFVLKKRPDDLTQDEAEQIYLNYLSTCVQAIRDEGDTDAKWKKRKEAGRFDYKKYVLQRKRDVKA